MVFFLHISLVMRLYTIAANEAMSIISIISAGPKMYPRIAASLISPPPIPIPSLDSIAATRSGINPNRTPNIARMKGAVSDENPVYENTAVITGAGMAKIANIIRTVFGTWRVATSCKASPVRNRIIIE